LFVLVAERRISGDDVHPGYFREICNQIISHAVAEIFLIGIGRKIVEWQYGN